MSKGDYYEALGGRAPHRESGWRRRVGQWVRFEMALGPWESGEIERVVDLGCGTGELAGWLESRGWDVEYLGLDLRREVIRRAAQRYDGTFRCEDFFEADVATSPGTLAVAVGAHVDGTSPEDRVWRLRNLLQRASTLADAGVAAVVLDHEVVQSRPMFRLEEALFGVTVAELRKTATDLFERSFVSGGGLSTDFVVYGTSEPERYFGGGCEGSAGEAPERVIEHRGARLGVEERIWLWLECGRLERAEREFEELEARGEGEASEELRHLERRLRRARE